MVTAELAIESWMNSQITTEQNARRRDLLHKGLGHGAMHFLKTVWYPAIGNLEHLHAEWEVRDFTNNCRYLDLAYMPGGKKGCIEIQGYRAHARDIEAWRFKDLCMKHALLALDDWLFVPIFYLSITENPEVCKQLVLAFVGKFVSMSATPAYGWAETETLRFARRLMRPFTVEELCSHLQRSTRQTRRVLDRLHSLNALTTNGQQRYRTYSLPSLQSNGQKRLLEQTQSNY